MNTHSESSVVTKKRWGQRKKPTLLRTLIASRGYGIDGFAEKIGVANSQLSRAANGLRVYDPARRKIEAAFPGMTLEELQRDVISSVVHRGEQP
jgi:hypothetical protein